MLEKKEKGHWMKRHDDGTSSGISIFIQPDNNKSTVVMVTSPVFGLGNVGWIFRQDFKDELNALQYFDEVDNFIDFILQIERHA